MWSKKGSATWDMLDFAPGAPYPGRVLSGQGGLAQGMNSFEETMTKTRCSVRYRVLALSMPGHTSEDTMNKGPVKSVSMMSPVMMHLRL